MVPWSSLWQSSTLRGCFTYLNLKHLTITNTCTIHNIFVQRCHSKEILNKYERKFLLILEDFHLIISISSVGPFTSTFIMTSPDWGNETRTSDACSIVHEWNLSCPNSSYSPSCLLFDRATSASILQMTQIHVDAAISSKILEIIYQLWLTQYRPFLRT